MQLETSDHSGIRAIRLDHPRFDASIAADFKSAISGFVAQGIRRFVFDFSTVEFIDSSGLGAIVSSLKMVGEQGSIAITGLRDNPRTMFKLTRMDRIFPLFDSVDAALADLSG
jgi:anti-sigma B factor antagonist